MDETMVASPDTGRDQARARIVAAAAAILTAEGRDALTTRTVAAAAGVQAPTIYRIFGDKAGLVDAVVEHGFAAFLAEKSARVPGPDPVEDLRAGWDRQVEFGLANPAVYALMYGDPRPGRRPSAVRAAERILGDLIGRIAAAGRLRIPEHLALELVHASGSGAILALLAQSEEERDPRFSHLAREAVVEAITTADTVADTVMLDIGNPAAAAITLRASLPENVELSVAERHLMTEWLDRLATPRPGEA